METREIVGDSEKQIAKEWFEELRDMICEDFEKIEILKDSGEFSSRPPGKFEKKQTFRKSKNGEDGGGEGDGGERGRGAC